MKTRKKTDKEKKFDDKATESAFRKLSMASIRFVHEFRDSDGDVSHSGWKCAESALCDFEYKHRQQDNHLVGDVTDHGKGVTSHYYYSDNV